MRKTIKNHFLKLFLFTVLFSNPLLQSYSQGLENPEALSGDFGIQGTFGYTIHAKLEAVSIPYEGATNVKENYRDFNRSQVQNGTYWRFFINSGNYSLERNIYKIEKTIVDNAKLDLGHCSGFEYPDESIEATWGFAKYLITLHVTNPSQTVNEIYKFYLNSLDSKFGSKLPNNQNYFVGDLSIRYDPQRPAGYRIVFSKFESSVGVTIIDYISVNDILPNGNPSKEFKVWEIKFGPNSQPLEQNFIVRTTPFGINPEEFHISNANELILGTKVKIREVFDNLGFEDRIGFNTYNTGTPFYNYFYYPPIPDNIPEYTVVTPAVSNLNDNGLTFIAEQNNELILDYYMRFWICGKNEITYDKFIFKPQSKITFNNSASLNLFNYGELIDEGCQINWATNSKIKVYGNNNKPSKLNFKGQNHYVNNGLRTRQKPNNSISFLIVIYIA